MKTFRAFKVDPATRTIEAIAFGNHENARQHVGTDDLDHAVLMHGLDVALNLFVDGQGYYKPELAWWSFRDYEYPLGGVGVIYGSDEAGATADVPLSLAEIAALISWIDGRPRLPNATVSTPDGLIAEVDFNAPDAPKSQAEFYRRMFGEDPPRKP
jgi:hypothetical protein